MKYALIGILLLNSWSVFSQRELSMNDTELRRELPMSETTGKVEDGLYKYYAKGESKPFTGILYGKYPNGEWLTRQEYVDGVGQGSWINYYDNGNFKEVGNYEQNRVEGSIKKYYRNGQLKSEGTYREWRIRIGEWKYYNEAGKLIETVNHGKKGDYRDVEFYYKNGSISKTFYEKLRKN